MWLEIADHDVDATPLELVRLGQHLVRLADAGRVAEKDLQMAPGPRRLVHCGNTRTSIPSASRIKRSSGVPPRRERQFRRRLWPTKICVMFCSRAYSRIVAIGSLPVRVSTCAPWARASMTFRSSAI